MTSGPITSWKIERKNMEVGTDSLLLGCKITAGGDCSHEIRCLLLGRKVTTNLGSVAKQRLDSVDNGPYSQGYGLPSGHMWL